MSTKTLTDFVGCQNLPPTIQASMSESDSLPSVAVFLSEDYVCSCSLTSKIVPRLDSAPARRSIAF